MDLGIDDGGYIKTVAHHYYQNNGGTPDELPTGKGLMNVSLMAFSQKDREICRFITLALA